MMGFEVQDAVALLRLEDLYVDSFLVTDVKMLAGDHLSRAIGRVAGQDGKVRRAAAVLSFLPSFTHSLFHRPSMRSRMPRGRASWWRIRRSTYSAPSRTSN
jgi:hypothetical protein